MQCSTHEIFSSWRSYNILFKILSLTSSDNTVVHLLLVQAVFKSTKMVFPPNGLFLGPFNLIQVSKSKPEVVVAKKALLTVNLKYKEGDGQVLLVKIELEDLSDPRKLKILETYEEQEKNSHSKQKRLPVFEEYSSVALCQKFLLPSVTLILKRTGAVNKMSGLQIPSVNELRVRVICCLICIVLKECFDVNKEIQKGFIIQSGCLFWLVLLLWFIW